MRQATRRAPLADKEPARRRRLAGKVALVVLGEGAIGRAVVLAFAREGADVAIVYFNDHRQAEETRQLALLEGVRCILLSGDATRESFCRFAARKVLNAMGRLDILVNDAGNQKPYGDVGKPEIEDAFRASLLGMFFLTKAVAPRLADGGAIINTVAAPADPGDQAPLTEYAAATKNAAVAFTRSLARALRDRRIRVNAVDPDPESAACRVATRDADVDEIVPSYVALAMRDAGFKTGQVLHPAADRRSR
jgi:NAD(P)-dependent dehydrogenase (short-subunit alcohol dehydrogenase family)